MNISKMRSELNSITWGIIINSYSPKDTWGPAGDFYGKHLIELEEIETIEEWEAYKAKYKNELQYKIKEMCYLNKLKKIEGDFNETQGI